MIAIIFEVEPAEGRKDQYLDIAAKMRPLVEQVDGFISVERFQSLSNPGKLLSISFFRDEAAVASTDPASPGTGQGTGRRVCRLPAAGGAGDPRLWHVRP